MQPENKVNLQGVVIWLICALFLTYELSLRTVLGTFQNPIMQDLSLTPLSFALMSTTCYLIVYSLMQLPAGIITTQYGLKKSLLFAVGLCTLSSVAFAYTYDLKTALFVRMIMGLGSSFGFVCVLMSVYDWMPKKHYGLYVGLSQFIGLTGPMMAAGPLNNLVLQSNTNWRTVLLCLSLAGISLILLVIAFVKKASNNPLAVRIISKQPSISKNLYQLLSQHQIWLIAIYSAFIYFSVEYLAENEGKAFIEMNNYSPSFSSYMITVGWLGCAIGCPVLGSISDFLKRRKLVMVFAALCSLLSAITIVYFPVSKTVLTIAFFMLGFGAGGQSIGFAIMAEQCSKTYLAVGLGFNNAMLTILMSINAPIIGSLLSFHSQSSHLSLSDYHFAFSYIVLMLVFATFLSIFYIRETYCRPTKEYTYINWLSFLKVKRVYTQETKALASK